MKFSYFLLVQSELDENVMEVSSRSLKDLQSQFSKVRKAIRRYESVNDAYYYYKKIKKQNFQKFHN